MSGLEVVGSVASVLQLAATVYTISKTLYKVGSALSNAPLEINDLARDLETFSEELHLLSSLLEDKTRRYSDRVYQLTARIIGDCASICIKIDKILRKLRSGSFLARVKWVFKEKDIMKLLTRLRDLKLSLMGILGLLSALKADHMMDAMGVGKPSLLERQSDGKLERKTEEQVAATRKALSAISTSQNTQPSFVTVDSTPTPALSVFNVSLETRKIPEPAKEEMEISTARSFHEKTHTSRFSRNQMESRSPDDFAIISTIALPIARSLTQLPRAMESVESFHSARSRQDSREVLGDEFFLNGITEDSPKVLDQAMGEWRVEMAEVAMKRFHMDHAAAVSWASRLPPPNPSGAEAGSKIPTRHEAPETQTQTQEQRAAMKSSSGLINLTSVSKISSTYGGPRTEIEVGHRRAIELKMKELRMEEREAMRDRRVVEERGSLEEGKLMERKMELMEKKKRLEKLKEMRRERLKVLAQKEPQNDSTHAKFSHDDDVTSMTHSESVKGDEQIQRRPHTQRTDFVLKDKIISSRPDLLTYYGISPRPDSDRPLSLHSPVPLSSAAYYHDTLFLESRWKLRSRAGDWHPKVRRSCSPTRNYSSEPETSTAIGGNTTTREKFRMGASNTESFRKAAQAKYRPSQGDAMLVSLKGEGKQPENMPNASRNELNDQSQLWNRAFFRLRTDKIEDSVGLWEAWQLIYSNSHTVPDATEDFVARVAATELAPIIKKARTEFLELSIESTKIAASSINRFHDILKVIQETLNFQPGAFIWTCLCAAEKKLIKNISNYSGLEDPRIPTLVDISEIAALVARYNVLESMYRHWPGMSLNEEYEESLIDLCVKVLGYLNLVLTDSFDLETNKNLMNDIREADTKCRKFSVMIEEEGTKAFESKVKDIETDSSDSDSSFNGGFGVADVSKGMMISD